MSSSFQVRRWRGALSILSLLGSAGLALAQTYYWRFELVAVGQGGDRHLLIGEIAATAAPSGTSATMAAPLSSDYQTYWSSNVNASTGQGGVGNGGTNYQVTRVGSLSGSFTCSTNCANTSNTAGSGWSVNTVDFFWTDASGASYELVRSGGVNKVYNATYSNSTYTQGSQISPSTTYSILWQGQDPEIANGYFRQNQGFETGYGPNTFPEIDGARLPKAALMLFAVYLFYRKSPKALARLRS